MALQTSGAISLNQIHVEAGGSSGTQASINDTDIRDMIGKGSGAQASFSEYYGASSGPVALGVVNVTAGLFSDKIGDFYGYRTTADSTSFGSVDTAVTNVGVSPLGNLYTLDFLTTLSLWLYGPVAQNAWSTMTIVGGSTNLSISSSSANYDGSLNASGGTVSSWNFPSITTNPFQVGTVYTTTFFP